MSNFDHVTKSENRDYDFTIDQLEALADAIFMPDIKRLDVLYANFQHLDKMDLIKIMDNMIAMALSVAHNNVQVFKNVIVETGVELTKLHDRPNLPSFPGAILGALLATRCEKDAPMCSGCAFRKGSPANQSDTVLGAAHCAEMGAEDVFWCHHNLDQTGDATQICQGWKNIVTKESENAQ